MSGYASGKVGTAVTCHEGKAKWNVGFFFFLLAPFFPCSPFFPFHGQRRIGFMNSVIDPRNQPWP